MVRYRLPKSIRKYIRKEKSRLRRESLDPAEAEKGIAELVANTFEKYGKKGGLKVTRNRKSETRVGR